MAYAIGDGIKQPLGVLAVPVGELALETPINFSINGLWFEPAKAGQGVNFVPIPRENRLVGNWYTFANDNSGAQRWYLIDSCRAAPGSTVCSQSGSFNGKTGQLSIYEATGGRLNTAGGVSIREVGVMNVEFSDCKNAVANYTFTAGASGTLTLNPLTLGPGCR